MKELKKMTFNPIETELDERSIFLRKQIIRCLQSAGRGHVGPAMSLIEILRVLYDDVLNIDPKNDKDPKRDRLILSKGHGCLALYTILADKGFFEAKELDSFCAFDSKLGGHPEYGMLSGVEASTGALGHGMSIGVGLALSSKLKKINNKTFVIMGDGEINEGSVWEAFMSASKHKLDNLVAVIDYNKIQSYGKVSEVLPLDPLAQKLEAFGFATIEVDGHNVKDLQSAFSNIPMQKGKPTAVICHTVKGKGIPDAENNPLWHHKRTLKENELVSIREALGEI
jgi:transketolase